MSDRRTTSPGIVVGFPRPHADNRSIVDGIKRGEAEAGRLFYDKFGAMVNRLVWRLLGADSEHDDVVHEVFIAAISSLGNVRDPEHLDRWISRLAVNTVSGVIQRRRLYRFLYLVPRVPEEIDEGSGPEEGAFLNSLYGVLDAMKTNDRIVLVLRFMEGQQLTDIALTTGWSLATVKRRLLRARTIFLKKARRDPILSSAIEDDEHA